MSQPSLSLNSSIEVGNDLVSRDMGSEGIVLDLGNGSYYGLNKVAARAWNLLLQEPRTVAELLEMIMEEYEVEAERCKGDLLEFLQKLLGAGLVRVSDASSTDNETE